MTASHVLSHLSYSPMIASAVCPSASDRNRSHGGSQVVSRCVSLFLLLFALLPGASMVESAPVRVVHIVVDGTIDLGLPPFVERAIRTAQEEGAIALILEVNTLGGRVDAASRIRDVLLDCPLTTVAFVNKRAISAGALISLACDTIVMAPGSTIGAATPVTLGSGGGEKASEKVVSYWRSEMRATAEKTNRPPEIAEAMVDESVEIPDISPAGKLLTLTSAEAVENGIADAEIATLEGALDFAGLSGADVIRLDVNWAENVVRFFTNPVLSGFLLSIGFLGIIVELRSPGFGFPGIAGVTALALFFGVHYVVHLAGQGELIALIAGLLLLALEFFVIPGFGIAGIAGIALVLGTVFFSMIGSLPGGADISRALVSFAVSLVLTVGGTILLFRYMPKSRSLSRLILAARQERADGFEVTAAADRDLLGAVGTARSKLRPAGVADIGGRRVDVVTEGDFIDAGRAVEVVAVDGNRVVVREACRDG